MKDRRFLEEFIRKIFSFYVFIVIFGWIFLRIVSPSALTEATKGINIPTLLQKYEEIYNTQNIPQDNLVHRFAPVIFLLVLLVISLKFRVFASWFKTTFQSVSTAEESKPNSVRNIWFTGFFVVTVLLIKEIIDPFYFTQDDNHAQFLPKILVGLGMLFQGEFPFIDNYQHFGSPLFEIGTYAMLDPVMIISYAVCKYILQQPYATLEMYVIVSIFIGAIFLGYAFRMMKVDSFLSFSAIVCFLLSGYFLITIRSWYYVTGITFYMPALLFFFLYAISKGSGWSWFLSAGVIRGVFFYAGNAQYFVYTVLLEAAAYTFVAFKRKQPAFLVRYFYSILLTTGVALPLLLPQLEMQKEIERGAERVIAGAGMPLDALISTIVPYPLSWAPHPCRWGNQNTYLMTNMFHIGFIWALTFITGVIGFIRANAGEYRALLILGTVLFFISGGVVSYIYPLKHYIPLLNKMQIAFKWFPYAVFAITIYSMLILNDIKKTAPYRKTVLYLVSLSVIISLVVALFGTSTSFYTYGEKPYPDLNKGISNVIKQDDIVFGLAPLRYEMEPYSTALIHNYGCLYDIKTTNFYDPLLPTKINDFPENLDDYFSKHGVTKAVLLKTKPHVEYWEYPGRDEHIAWMSKYPIVHEDDNIALYNTNQLPWIIRPKAYSEIKATHQILEYDRAKIRAKINSVRALQWEYHNEYRKGYYINVNGVRNEISRSPDGWCLFELRAGESQIEIRYLPPVFWTGVTFGLFTLLIAIAAFVIDGKRNDSMK